MAKKFKVKADSLNVRKTPSSKGEKINSFLHGTVVTFIDKSEDEQWYLVESNAVKGWVAANFLVQYEETAEEIKYGAIFNIVLNSTIKNYNWKNRGLAKIGYYKGMALVFAKMYCKLKTGDAVATEMAKANTGNLKKDVLAYYADLFDAAGMSNENDGIDTLRHLFVFMIGLGMRESSGKYCEGRDMAANNTSSETAEAGLFQTSYNAVSSSPLLKTIFLEYKANPNGFENVFKDGGISCSVSNWEDYGTGEGREFQRLSKKCPAFAVEFTGVALRNIRGHWGPVNRYKVELKKECNQMLLQVQQLVDTNNLCPI